MRDEEEGTEDEEVSGEEKMREAWSDVWSGNVWRGQESGAAF